MHKKIYNYTGIPLRITYDFTNKRDLKVGQHSASYLKDKYTFDGELSYNELLNPVSEEDRILFLRETIGLSNKEAVQAKLIPQSLHNSSRLIMPEEAKKRHLVLPFVGAFLPPEQLEIATKLSIHPLSPTTKKSIPNRLQNVQKFSSALKIAPADCVLDGWIAIDSPGADFAAKDLLSKGGTILIKYGRGSLGQYQWSFSDQTSYKAAMKELNETMTKKNIDWQESGLVFERKLNIHDQLVIGQFNFMDNLISWIGRMDHAPVRNINGHEETIYTGSTKMFILGSMKDCININLSSEVIEDLKKARQFEEIMEQHVHGGVITRIQYNLLRGITTKYKTSSSKSISGITEVTLREGGGTGAEMRVIRALIPNNNSLFKPAQKIDRDLLTELNGISIIMGSTYLEYFSNEKSYQKKLSLPENAEILYDGPDSVYGFVRIYTVLHSALPFLKNAKNLQKFLYPTLA